ncbi:hypothetical protein ISS05_05425, partial [Candidatus Woesearchaeota archaeon]|nr:hypothetical protein [Candidatus Woesearchaeota archaeon]
MKIKRFNKKANIIPLLFGILLIITVFYFGFFMDSTENKISGAVIGMESVSGMVTEKGIYQSTRWEDQDESTQQWLLKQWKQGEPKYEVISDSELKVVDYTPWTVEQVQEKYGDQAAGEYSKYSNNVDGIGSNPSETFEKLPNGNILVTKTQSTGMGDGSTFKTIEEINPKGVVVSSEFILNDKSDAQKKADEYLKETGKGEKDISEIKIGRSVETLTQQKASALVSNMLRMLLGKFGFDKVSEICKA